MASLILEDSSRQVRLEVFEAGEGEDVVLVPSAMRGAKDFSELQASLAGCGFRSLAVNLRGAGRSSLPTGDISLRDLADDIRFVVRTVCSGRAHLVGHALGNIVVRATASYHPDVVSTVTVMPCGGHNLSAYPVSQEVLSAFSRCHDVALPDQKRIDALQIAFFAPGNDPRPWLEGWYPASSLGGITTDNDPEGWWRAGSAPMLIIQPLADAMAPVESGRDAAAAIGTRATYVEVPDCGHAILPEQPEAIAAHLVSFLASSRGSYSC